MDVLFILTLQLIDFHQLFPRFKLFSMIMWAGNYLSFSCCCCCFSFWFSCLPHFSTVNIKICKEAKRGMWIVSGILVYCTCS